MDVVKKCFGWLAIFMNVNFYISPTRAFINILTGKINYEEFPIAYIGTCYLNCLLWYIYGRMSSNYPIKISYMISGIITLIFIFTYLIFESKKYLCDAVLNTFFVVSGTWIIYRGLILIIGKINLVRYICIGTTILIFLFPFFKFYKILKEKNKKFVQVFSSWKFIFSSICWIVYAILIKNYFLIIPNAIGIFFSLINFFMNFYIKKKRLAFRKRDSTGNINIGSGTNDENKKEEIPIKLDDDIQAQIGEKQVEIVNKL